MSQQHPITPPPELVGQWQVSLDCPDNSCAQAKYIAAQAAQWGADQELEACCAWLSFYSAASDARDLRIARRPKPPSLKEQALAALDDCANCLDGAHENTIRRALEALDD